MHFAHEGYIWIISLGIASLFLGILDASILSGITLMLALFAAFFFRDPDRNIPSDPKYIISPADGRVVNVEESTRAQVVSGRGFTRVGIFLSPLNVHVNRVPISGEVMNIDYVPGKYLPAFSKDAADVNEQNILKVTDSAGREVVLVQIAGMLARRIVCRAEVGDQVVQGERYGMIMLGSRVDIYFPVGANLKVHVGQRVIAGETVLGEYPAGQNVE